MRAIIKGAFAITGRGTSIAVDLTEGGIKAGDNIKCPMRTGECRTLLVAGVEFSDSIRRQESRLALTVGAVVPEDIVIDGEIVGEQ